MHTMVIAGSKATAVSIAMYYSMRELPRKAFFNDAAQIEHAQKYGACSASNAYANLLGEKPDRIIIGGDYLRWHLGEPGRLTNLWRLIQTNRARGTKVVFN